MPFVHDDSIVLPKLKQQNLSTGRVYLVESGDHVGNVYPSITRVLGKKEKPQLEAWKKRVGAEKAEWERKIAIRKGSSLHSVAEYHLANKDLPKYMPDTAELWSHLRPWVNTHVSCVYHQEYDVYSDHLSVAGRGDVLADVQRELAIIDFKNAKRPKTEELLVDYRLQSTFYACCVYELTGRKVKKCYIPIAYPGGLQVVEFRPKDYIEQLIARIHDYYTTTK